VSHNIPPYNVNILLDKNLLEEGPDWYKGLPFWVDDGTSIQRELFKKKPYLHSGCNKGCYVEINKKPAVGQNVVISVRLPNSPQADLGLLSGSIVTVFDKPTNEELKNSNSFLLGKVSTLYLSPCKFNSTHFSSSTVFDSRLVRAANLAAP